MLGLMLTVIFGLSLAAVLWRFRARPIAIPGPRHFFYLGSFAEMYKHRKRLPDWLYECTQLHKGTWSFSIPSTTPYIVINSPENLEHVLKHSFDKYEKGSAFREHFQELLGDGIFNTDGALWKEQRQLALQQFRRRELREHISAVMIARSNAVLELLEQKANDSEIFDLQSVFYAYTLDTFSEIAFGHNIDSLHAESSFAQAFDRSQWLVNRRFTTPWWRLERRLDIGQEKSLRKSVQHLNSYVAAIVQERMALSSEALADKPDLLSKFTQQLLDAETESATTESAERYLIDVVLNFMIAGRDTTAGALTWTFYRFWKHPQLHQRVVDEVLSVVGDAPLEYEHIGQLPFTRAFFFETLRLHPSVAKNLKYAIADDRLPDGTAIPSGCGVIYSSYVMGRMEDIWGQDVLEFKPERWLTTTNNGQLAFREKDPYQFPHFNAGPRICLGKYMAVMEAELLIMALVRRFRFELAVSEREIRYLDTLTAPVDNGLRVTESRTNHGADQIA